jgi:hypothetical protein
MKLNSIGNIPLPKAAQGKIAVVILNDGETYSSLEGCSIAYLTPKELQKVQELSGGEKDVFNALPKTRRLWMHE